MRSLACCLCLLVPTSAHAQPRVRTVQDDAGYFSKKAIDEANAVVARIKNVHGKGLLIETVNVAVAQAQKVLEKTATQEDHERLANELLAELSRRLGNDGPAERAETVTQLREIAVRRLGDVVGQLVDEKGARR